MSSTEHSFHKPDYSGGGIVNLISSIVVARGGLKPAYPTASEIDPSAMERSRNVMLMVIDGLGYNYLTQSSPAGALRHHLAGRLTSVFPSTTATAVTTFLTGLAPQQHGLTGWFTHFKEWDTTATVLLFRSRTRNVSLTELGVDPAAMFDHSPIFDQIATAAYTVMPSRIAFSHFNIAHTGRARIRTYDSLPEFFSVCAETLRASDEPKYVYAYWPEFDRLAHEFGVASDEVRAHFRDFDTGFAGLLADIRGSDTTLIATADHGFIDLQPGKLVELRSHLALEDRLALPLCGEPRAAFCYVRPGKGDDFANYVEERLAEHCVLYESSELLNQGYFGPGQPHPRLADRIGRYTLIMKDGCMIKDRLAHEREHSLIGVHGGLSADEMYVPLILAKT